MNKPVKHLYIRSLNAKTSQAILQYGSLTIACSLGKLGKKHNKREGDRATPIAKLHLQRVYFRSDRIQRPKTGLPITALPKNLGWCDEPTNRNYNRPVALPYSASHENLHRQDNVYDIIIITRHNQRPRIKGLGSAIFFHLQENQISATAGCVAIKKHDMLKILPRLNTKTKLVILP